MPTFVPEHVALALFRKLHQCPDVDTVEVHEGRLLSLIERLLRGEVDAVRSLFAPRAVDGLDLSMLDIQPFLRVPMVVIASSKLAVPQGKRWWQDLCIYPWIAPPASTHQRRAVDEMFTARGSQAPAPVLECASPSANVRFAAAGLGLAVVPLKAAEREIQAGDVNAIDVRPVLPETTMVLMYRKVSAIYVDSLRALNLVANEIKLAGHWPDASAS